MGGQPSHQQVEFHIDRVCLKLGLHLFATPWHVTSRHRYCARSLRRVYGNGWGLTQGGSASKSAWKEAEASALFLDLQFFAYHLDRSCTCLSVCSCHQI